MESVQLHPDPALKRVPTGRRDRVHVQRCRDKENAAMACTPCASGSLRNSGHQRATVGVRGRAAEPSSRAAPANERQEPPQQAVVSSRRAPRYVSRRISPLP